MIHKIPTRALLIFAFLLYGPISNTTGDFMVLDSNLSDFKSDFNADNGKLRLVMYVSPTCGGCPLGANSRERRDSNIAARSWQIAPVTC